MKMTCFDVFGKPCILLVASCLVLCSGPLLVRAGSDDDMYSQNNNSNSDGSSSGASSGNSDGDMDVGIFMVGFFFVLAPLLSCGSLFCLRAGRAMHQRRVARVRIQERNVQTKRNETVVSLIHQKCHVMTVTEDDFIWPETHAPAPTRPEKDNKHHGDEENLPPQSESTVAVVKADSSLQSSNAREENSTSTTNDERSRSSTNDVEQATVIPSEIESYRREVPAPNREFNQTIEGPDESTKKVKTHNEDIETGSACSRTTSLICCTKDKEEESAAVDDDIEKALPSDPKITDPNHDNHSHDNDDGEIVLRPSELPKTASRTCAICLCPYETGDMILWSSHNPACRHAFHRDCLEGWWRANVAAVSMTSDRSNSLFSWKPQCPSCRQEFAVLPAVP